MKSYFFHLMPWTDYPPDFDETYESSWVTFPNRFYDPVKGADLYHRYLDELEYADALGFDGICVNEHHQNAYGLMPSPNVVAGMLARRTRRAKIAILGNGLPLRPGNPLRVAEEIAMLDVVTRGRIISGFVRGIGCEYLSLNLDPTTSRDMFLEAHDLIVAAWTRPGPFEWNGRFWQYRYVNPWPRPWQKPHPPIWLPSAGSAETIELAAEKRYPYVSVFTPIENVKRLFDGYRGWARERVGYEPHPEQLGYAPGVYVGDDQRRAEEEAAAQGEFFRTKAFKIPPHFLMPPGYTTERSLRGFVERMQAVVASGDTSFFGLAIAGTPRTVIDKLVADYDFLGGFGFIICGGPTGATTGEQVRRHMTLFQQEVVPALRRYHAERHGKGFVDP
jgi:alkanesulfonate monooxygenase SsuD/methylene tetrahydromethanopterin reductase-like flavin-dependent oxidoreductase (luciferase family)